MTRVPVISQKFIKDFTAEFGIDPRYVRRDTVGFESSGDGAILTCTLVKFVSYDRAYDLFASMYEQG